MGWKLRAIHVRATYFFSCISVSFWGILRKILILDATYILHKSRKFDCNWPV